MKRLFIHGAPALLGALAAAAAAQSPPAGGAPELAPTAAWHSAFEGYRPFSDEKTASWPQANDTVLRAGGWRAYAREAAQPASAAAPAPAPKAGASQPHAGHHQP